MEEGSSAKPQLRVALFLDAGNEVQPCAWCAKQLSCGSARFEKLMTPIPNIKTLPLLGVALVMASCAAPKAIVVEQAPVPKKQEIKPEPLVVESELPAFPDDGIRMPEMLGMPEDGDFRSANPTGVKQSGAVISRPPTDPPSRVKPKAADRE